MTLGSLCQVFPGKATKPGFSFSWSALCLVPLISSKGPADIDGKNSVVKMRVYFGSPQKKQAIYGNCASAPSKKRVKMQSQLMSPSKTRRKIDISKLFLHSVREWLRFIP